MKIFGEPIQQNQLKRGEFYEIVYTKMLADIKNTLYRYGVFVEQINNGIKLKGLSVTGILKTITINNIIRIRPINMLFTKNICVFNIDDFTPFAAVAEMQDVEGNIKLFTNNDLSILTNYRNPNWRKSLTNIFQIHISQITDVLPMSINDIITYGTAFTEPNKVGDVYTALFDENLESYFGGKKKSTKKRWSKKYKRSINCKKPKGFSQKQYCKYGRKRVVAYQN